MTTFSNLELLIILEAIGFLFLRKMDSMKMLVPHTFIFKLAYLFRHIFFSQFVTQNKHAHMVYQTLSKTRDIPKCKLHAHMQ